MSLFAAFATILVCCWVGRALLSRLGLVMTRSEGWAFGLLTGAALVSLLVLLMGLAGLLNRWTLLLLGSVLAAVHWRSVPHPRAWLPPLPKPWRWTMAAVLPIYAFSYLAVAMAPEISPDGMAYHLPLVQCYLREGAIRAIPTDLYAQLSQGLEMVFLPAYGFGRHSAAALVHLAFLGTLPLLMIAYGKRLGYAGSAAAAALLVPLAPVVGADASAAYNDVALAAVTFGVFLALRCWQADSPNWLVVAGLLSGFAFAIKYTAVFTLAAALVAVLWRRSNLRNAVRFLVPALLMMLPWLLKNYAFAGNPLAPFFNVWFPNNILDWPLEQEYLRAVQNYPGYTSARTIPWEVTVLGGTLQGLLGPVFLLLPIALFSLRYPEGRRLLLAGVVAALPFTLNHGTRFLIPGLAFFTLALARSLQPWPAVLGVVVAFHAVLSWPGVVESYAAKNAWRIKEIPWAAALGRESEEEFLLRKLPDYPLIKTLNALTRPGEPVLAFRQYAASYSGVDLQIDNRSRSTAELCRVLYIPVLEARHPTSGERFWFPKSDLTGIRIRKEPGSVFTATEVRLFDLMQTVQLPDSPHIAADPPRDDAANSFDGNRLTRWRGGLNPQRSAQLELTWRQPVRLTRVDVEHRPIHPEPQLTLYGRYRDGEWRTLTRHVQPVLAGPIPQVRAAATQELLSRGIRYVLLHHQDLIAPDVQQNLSAWNWRLLQENRGMSLYQLLPRESAASTDAIPAFSRDNHHLTGREK